MKKAIRKTSCGIGWVRWSDYMESYEKAKMSFKLHKIGFHINVKNFLLKLEIIWGLILNLPARPFFAYRPVKNSSFAFA